MLAWHFLKEDRRLRWGTMEEVKPGQKLTVEPPLLMCRHGLHASVKPIDALRYGPGPIICRVELSGEIIEEEDKVCATERTCLWIADATRTLHVFAIWCAEWALNLERQAGREPDPRSWAAVQAKKDWLEGKITDDELAAARAAAWAAAWEAAEASVCTAARNAAEAAAEAAARNAAWNAAWNAADAAADAAARNAAWVAQSDKLTEMLLSLEPKE